MLIKYRASHTQHMQKALDQMNLKLVNVVTDITGKTGMAIIRDIIKGNQNPMEFGKRRPKLCK